MASHLNLNPLQHLSHMMTVTIVKFVHTKNGEVQENDQDQMKLTQVFAQLYQRQ